MHSPRDFWRNFRIRERNIGEPPSGHGIRSWIWTVWEWQVEQFREMGMGGFYIHTRIGLDTEYMGPEYMECVKKAAALAKEKNLFCCLYDEDRWPSGAPAAW